MTKRSKKKTNGNGGGGSSVTFKVGDIVGARVKGYPIWPAKVIHKADMNNKTKYTVEFYLTKETSQHIAELKHFKDLSDKELACKKKDFQEALSICREEYETLQGKNGVQLKSTLTQDDEKDMKQRDLAVKSKKDSDSTTSTTPYHSTTSSPQRESDSISDKLEIVQSDDVKQKEEPLKKRKRLSKKVDVEVKRQKSDPEKDVQKQEEEHLLIENSEKSNTITVAKEKFEEHKVKPPKSPKKEVGSPTITENPKFKQTLMKLTNKVEMKLKEKEDMKREKKRKKLSDKIFQKLEIINQNLNNLHKLTTNIQNEHHNKSKSDWETAVQMFIKTLPALERCINLSKNSNISKSPSKSAYFEKFHKDLVELIILLKEFKRKKTDDVSDYRIIKIDTICESLKKHRKIKEFVNDARFTQDMIGRKENDDK